MRPITKDALLGAAAGVPASLFVAYWARQLSIIGVLIWLVLLVPAGACTAIVARVASRRPGLSVFRAVLYGLLGAVIGTLLICAEALILGALRVLPISSALALSNAVPGTIIGVLATYHVLRSKSAAEH